MTDIPNLTEAELTALETSTSETEWNKICDSVKRARGGVYPADWYARVIQSGMLNKAQVRWA